MDNDMNDTSKADRSSEACILEKNKAKLWEVAKKNNKYNEKGQCLITKQDEDYTHDEWEDDSK